MLRRSALALAVALLAIAAIAPTARAADAVYEGISTTGDVVFFSTKESLVPGDTDASNDVYARSYDVDAESFVTRQVSFGPSGGNNVFDAQFIGNDGAGKRAYFETRERLTPEDKDQALDIYVRDLEDNTTVLVTVADSACPIAGCGAGTADATAPPGGVSADGDVVFFVSQERFAPADQDSALDIYARNLLTEETTLVSAAASACSAGTCGNGAFSVFFQGVSADGNRVFFTTTEALIDPDVDGAVDIYGRDIGAGSTMLVSVPGVCPAGANCTPVYEDTSEDGSRVFFGTEERIAGDDLDSAPDVYEWSGGSATRISNGPDGGNADIQALFAGISGDGSTAFFETTESLLSADTDSAQDVYARSGGTTTLVSVGAETCGGQSCNLPAAVVEDSLGAPTGVADDGGKVYFTSAEPLAATDEDESADIYVRDLVADTTTQVSRGDPSCDGAGCGNGEFHARFAAASVDGARVFFTSNEPLTVDDTDSGLDIFERTGEATVRVSTGPLPPHGNSPSAGSPGFRGISADGARVFFTTNEKLTEADGDSAVDVYERATPWTRLVSTHNAGSEGLSPPSGLTTKPAGSGATTTPSIHGTAAPGSTIKIYTSSDCSGSQASAPNGDPAIGTAAALGDPGVGIPVSVAPSSSTTFYATAELAGVVSACSAGVTYQHQPDTSNPGGEEPGGGDGEGGGGAGGGGTDPGGDGRGSGQPDKTHSGGIAYVRPVTRITFGPASLTRSKRPAFRFTDSTGQPGTRFLCKVNGQRWKGCRSPLRLKPLKPGKYVFRVKAINAIGEGEARPSVRRFKRVAR